MFVFRFLFYRRGWSLQPVGFYRKLRTSPGDQVVVTNGVYSNGGKVFFGLGTMTNRVALTSAIIVSSVNGPQNTFITGRGTTGAGQRLTRCAYIGTNAVLIGFTLTNGQSCGVQCEAGAILSNCVVIGCAGGNGAGVFGQGSMYNCLIAENVAMGNGGGAVTVTAYNCIFSNNVARASGAGTATSGGAYQCNLYNCVLQGNRADKGGAAMYSTLSGCTVAANFATSQAGGIMYSQATNSIVYFNSTKLDNSDALGGYADFCCMPQQSTRGITNEPRFVNLDIGDLHLGPDSPCINAGNNRVASTSTDLDGKTRIVNSTVDLGAYEYQGVGSQISYAWLQYFGFPADGSSDLADPDKDGMNNWQEWICGTDPTDLDSVFRLVSAVPDETGVTVTWQSVAGVNYSLERMTHLDSSTGFELVAAGIPGKAARTSYSDTNAVPSIAAFYRVGVSGP